LADFTSWTDSNNTNANKDRDKASFPRAKEKIRHMRCCLTFYARKNLKPRQTDAAFFQLGPIYQTGNGRLNGILSTCPEKQATHPDFDASAKVEIANSTTGITSLRV